MREKEGLQAEERARKVGLRVERISEIACNTMLIGAFKRVLEAIIREYGSVYATTKRRGRGAWG
jgi:hypothetical protein